MMKLGLTFVDRKSWQFLRGTDDRPRPLPFCRVGQQSYVTELKYIVKLFGRKSGSMTQKDLRKLNKNRLYLAGNQFFMVRPFNLLLKLMIKSLKAQSAQKGPIFCSIFAIFFASLTLTNCMYFAFKK